jgi:hypothetical protein
VKFGSWDGQKQGLLAGETLSLQLRQLESAHIDNNKREYELRRNISLRLLDPAALVGLIGTGSCEFELPEWLFDIDCPGLYMRRIRLLTITVPCVTGPQIPVHCKLTLLRHEIRQKPNSDAPDVHYDAIQSIVTSTALNDSGLFEPSMQDQRYLPFEGCGAVSRFRLELMNAKQFDATTISDVIVGMSYTAREGGDGFRASVSTLPQPAAPQLLMSYRHDFQDDWAALIALGTAAAQTAGSSPIVLNASTAPAIPLDRKPYRARVAEFQYKYADKAWALIALKTTVNNQVVNDGRFDIVEITPDKSTVQGGTPAPATPDAYFTVSGLRWTGTPKSTGANGTFDVVDIFLLYDEKKVVH